MSCLHHKEADKGKTLVSTWEKFNFFHRAKIFLHHIANAALAFSWNTADPYFSHKNGLINLGLIRCKTLYSVRWK